MGVSVDDFAGEVQAIQGGVEAGAVKSRLVLIEVDRKELEVEVVVALNFCEGCGEEERVLATGDTDSDPVTGLNQVEVPDGLAKKFHHRSRDGRHRRNGGVDGCSHVE